MKLLSKSIAALLGTGALLVSTSIAAAPILVTADFGPSTPPPNDCGGVFGSNDGSDGEGTICDVGFALDPPAEVSPIIAKHEYDDGVFDTMIANTLLFPSVSGSEFTITFLDEDGWTSGTWSYAPDDADDPAVRFWVAKDGNGFRLHWLVDEDDALGVCDTSTASSAYTLGCLDLALETTSGSWSTLGKALSHLTWYDTGEDFPPEGVPEPGTMLLLGAGLLGLAWTRRRRVW